MADLRRRVHFTSELKDLILEARFVEKAEIASLRLRSGQACCAPPKKLPQRSEDRPSHSPFV